MAKDPAVLFYISEWLTATAEMEADARGWYLNLILHNYDKGSLPTDPEKLAVLAGVKFSEFEKFKQTLEQVLMQKLKLNDETGRLENPKTTEILKSREVFKDKRQRSGNIGVVIKAAKNITGYTKKHIEWLKDELYSMTDENIEEAKSEQVLKQMLKLYINRNRNINKDISINEEEGFKEIARISFENNSCVFGTEFKKQWLVLLQSKKWRNKEQSAIDLSLKKLMKFDEPFACTLVENSIAGGYQGVTFDSTDASYQKYLTLKNGITKATTASAIDSRTDLIAAAASVLSQYQASHSV